MTREISIDFKGTVIISIIPVKGRYNKVNDTIMPVVKPFLIEGRRTNIKNVRECIKSVYKSKLTEVTYYGMRLNLKLNDFFQSSSSRFRFNLVQLISLHS